MKWPSDNPLHGLLILTTIPAHCPMWQVAPVSLVVAGIAGWVWARTTRRKSLGWAVATGLLFLAATDWALFASLPRWGLSFGPVQPPWLGLVVLRGLVALLAAYVARRWRATALTALALVQVGISVLAVYGTTVEPFRTQVGRLAVSSAKLADADTPLRIVQVSDLHVERLTRRERALPALVAGLKPDLIVLTGDYLSTTYNRDPRALADLRWLLSQFHAPGGIFAVWGTSDVDHPELLRPMFAELGITPLEDRATEVTVSGHRLRLLGVTCNRGMVGDGQRLSDLAAGVPAGAFTLLLYHSPDLMPKAASLGIDLFLAGHTHGGQCRVPGFGAVFTASRYWKRYEAGHYRQGNTDLYVSRGLGMEGFGAPRVRLFCPPEVVLVDLHGTGACTQRISGPRPVPDGPTSSAP
jgi:predicted MPP superfamily phosphohydrolase